MFFCGDWIDISIIIVISYLPLPMGLLYREQVNITVISLRTTVVFFPTSSLRWTSLLPKLDSILSFLHDRN